MVDWNLEKAIALARRRVRSLAHDLEYMLNDLDHGYITHAEYDAKYADLRQALEVVKALETEQNYIING